VTSVINIIDGNGAVKSTPQLFVTLRDDHRSWATKCRAGSPSQQTS